MNIERSQLEDLLKKAFDAGWSGFYELRSSVVDALIESVMPKDMPEFPVGQWKKNVDPQPKAAVPDDEPLQEPPQFFEPIAIQGQPKAKVPPSWTEWTELHKTKTSNGPEQY